MCPNPQKARLCGTVVVSPCHLYLHVIIFLWDTNQHCPHLCLSFAYISPLLLCSILEVELGILWLPDFLVHCVWLGLVIGRHWWRLNLSHGSLFFQTCPLSVLPPKPGRSTTVPASAGWLQLWPQLLTLLLQAKKQGTASSIF